MENQTQKTDSEFVQEYLINRDKEETELTIDCARALLALDLEIKDLRTDQKEIKKEAKDNGVSVQKVTKVLSIMKAALKTNDADLSEIEQIQEVFDHDVDIRTQLAEFVRKD